VCVLHRSRHVCAWSLARGWTERVADYSAVTMVSVSAQQVLPGPLGVAPPQRPLCHVW
jgi:hypothetical protein